MRRLWGASTFLEIGETVCRAALDSELKTLGVQRQNVYIPTGRASSDTRGRSNAAGHLYSGLLVPSIPRASVGFFTSISPWNGTAVHAGCSLAPSARFQRPLLFSSTAPLPASNADPLAGGAALPTLTLFSYGFSPPPTRIDPLFSTSQLFLICCSHPRSGRSSYQPGRTRVHILQAFMMAAAHLCKPVCLACLRQARPPSGRQRLPMLRGQPNFQSPFSFSGFFFFLILLPFYFLFISHIHGTHCPFRVAMLRLALHPCSFYIRACCSFPRVSRLFERYFSTVLNRSCS